MKLRHYPTHRKSPYKHKVRAHKRKGIPVRQYERGKGKKPKERPPLRRKTAQMNGSTYRVVLIYPERERETLTLTGRNYVEVINPALQSRSRLEGPRQVRIRRLA